jgi:2-C-methyl-D-erythritol 4-phosphate cytidylyltransferase
MKNIALVIAAGTGSRMHQEIPKQFLNVDNIPVIIYTLMAFQKHPLIHAIEVVCLEGWHETLYAYCRQFGIAKLENIVSGGESGQDSIRKGLYDLADRYHEDDDVVLVHDAIRPMVTSEIISNAIEVCRDRGNAITVIPCTAAMLKTTDGMITTEQVPRDNLKITQTPQTFFLFDLIDAHKEALERGITNSVASCTMYIELGRKLYLSNGSEKNIKLTSTDDLEIFKALLNSKKEIWMLD